MSDSRSGYEALSLEDLRKAYVKLRKRGYERIEALTEFEIRQVEAISEFKEIKVKFDTLVAKYEFQQATDRRALIYKIDDVQELMAKLDLEIEALNDEKNRLTAINKSYETESPNNKKSKNVSLKKQLDSKSDEIMRETTQLQERLFLGDEDLSLSVEPELIGMLDDLEAFNEQKMNEMMEMDERCEELEEEVESLDNAFNGIKREIHRFQQRMSGEEFVGSAAINRIAELFLVVERNVLALKGVSYQPTQGQEMQVEPEEWVAKMLLEVEEWKNKIRLLQRAGEDLWATDIEPIITALLMVVRKSQPILPDNAKEEMNNVYYLAEKIKMIFLAEESLWLSREKNIKLQNRNRELSRLIAIEDKKGVDLTGPRVVEIKAKRPGVGSSSKASDHPPALNRRLGLFKKPAKLNKDSDASRNLRVKAAKNIEANNTPLLTNNKKRSGSTSDTSPSSSSSSSSSTNTSKNEEQVKSAMPLETVKRSRS